MKLLIVNWAGLNTGDDAMLEAVVAKARARWQNLEIAIIGHHITSELASRLNVSVVGGIFETEEGIGKWGAISSAIRWADVVLVGGGDIIRERIASLLPFALAMSYGKPVAALSVGVVDISASRFWQRCFQLLMQGVSRFYVRDKRSHDLLASNRDAQSKLIMAPDVAFTHISPAASSDETLAASEQINVCVNIRELNDAAYLGVMSSGKSTLVETVKNFILSIPAEKMGVVRMVPMVDDAAIHITSDNRDSDLPTLRLLAEELSVHGIQSEIIQNRPTGLSELHDHFLGCQLIIGARYHFLIGALATDAAIYSIPYAAKVAQLMQQVPGIQDCAGKQYVTATIDELQARRAVVSAMGEQAASALGIILTSLDEALRTGTKCRLKGWFLTLLLASEPLSRGLRVRIGALLRALRSHKAEA